MHSDRFSTLSFFLSSSLFYFISTSYVLSSTIPQRSFRQRSSLNSLRIVKLNWLREFDLTRSRSSNNNIMYVYMSIKRTKKSPYLCLCIVSFKSLKLIGYLPHLAPMALELKWDLIWLLSFCNKKCVFTRGRDDRNGSSSIADDDINILIYALEK